MKPNRRQHQSRAHLVEAAVLAIFLCAGPVLHAQEGGKTGGSPLDTLMRTRLLADVPEAKDFVRQSRPPSDSLDYQPTSGSDPERPKPRTKAELEALRSELEMAAASNGRNARRLMSGNSATATHAAAPKARKAKLEKTQMD